MVDTTTRLGVLHALLRQRPSRFWRQFFRYLFVGGFAAVVDIGLVYLLAYLSHLHYLLAVAAAFIVGNVVNYVGCVLFIFRSSRRYRAEISMLLVVSAVGLLINETVIWLLHGRLGVLLMVAKVIAVTIAMFWNFVLRRVLVFNLGHSSDSVDVPR